MITDLHRKNVLEEKIPMVEVFSTVEGEGLKAGYPTTFVRVFNCNLRCKWCDTTYSYAPMKPQYLATIPEIVQSVVKFSNKHLCLTGGEPLIHKNKSLQLIEELSKIDYLEDIHIETNGAIDLEPFHQLRNNNMLVNKKVRFVIDYKLPDSGENNKMIHDNFLLLEDRDEIKFVIASNEDFHFAKNVLDKWYKNGTPLFSPVWESMPPQKLVGLILENELTNVKLNLQLHKIIWHPDQRGV
ncbi:MULTISPECIES: 7-carboxy-7-deazaguanine synthase QueE [Bacillus]|nr:MULTISPECIES: radical SAM protein [Bacillus]KXY56682.1 radical SAM protein [Bacillus cereus]MEB8804781.1 4Fe-4S cluster-binding domain-containing protein [Bacillus cereus]